MNKRLFKEFAEGKIIVNCRTEKEAREFLDYLADEGYKWLYSDIKKETNFDQNEENTYYKISSVYNKTIYYGSMTLSGQDYKSITYKELINETINTKLFEEFKNSKLAIHCPTEEEANEFINYCHKQGLTWCSGRTLLNDTNYNSYKERTLYECTGKGLSYGTSNYYSTKTIEYKELLEGNEMKNVMQKSDLKTGMWIEKRNGALCMVLLDTPRGSIYTDKNGVHGEIDYFNDNLTSTINAKHDIVKVYSPKYRNIMYNFDTKDTNNYKIVFERKDNSKEIEELRKTIKEAQDSLNNAQKKLKELEDK